MLWVRVQGLEAGRLVLAVMMVGLSVVTMMITTMMLLMVVMITRMMLMMVIMAMGSW